MTTLTTTGSVDALFGYTLDHFGTASNALVSDFGTTFNTIDVFDKNSPTPTFYFATKTPTSVTGYDINAGGFLSITGTNLNLAYNFIPGSGTYTVADFRSGTVTGTDHTFTPDGLSHFHIVGTLNWSYTAGDGGPKIGHNSTLTSFDYGDSNGELTIVGSGIKPDDNNPGNLVGKFLHETLTRQATGTR